MTRSPNYQFYNYFGSLKRQELISCQTRKNKIQARTLRFTLLFVDRFKGATLTVTKK